MRSSELASNIEYVLFRRALLDDIVGAQKVRFRRCYQTRLALSDCTWHWLIDSGKWPQFGFSILEASQQASLDSWKKSTVVSLASSLSF